jgi:hypothetical protein
MRARVVRHCNYLMADLIALQRSLPVAMREWQLRQPCRAHCCQMSLPSDSQAAGEVSGLWLDAAHDGEQENSSSRGIHDVIQIMF